MSASNPPDGPDDNEQLAVETLPILAKVHARTTQGLMQMDKSASVLDLVKSVFDGALHAHDRARTQDWSKLETQLENVAADAIISLILLRRRHAKA